ADLAILPNGRTVPLIEDELPIKVNWEGHIRFPQYFIIPKGAKNYDSAMEFLAYFSNPEILAKISPDTNYGPINEDSYEFIDEDLQKLLPGNPETVDLGRD